MSTDDSEEGVITPFHTLQVLHEMRKGSHGARATINATGLSPEISALRTWQSRRLSNTYADLFINPRYKPAAEFFLSEIYAPVDFSQRDHDILRVYRFLQRFFPPNILNFLALTVELNTLTQKLDNQLAEAIFIKQGVKMITAEAYAQGYRICDNYVDRYHQIDLILDVGKRVEKIVKLPFISLGIRMAKQPAYHGGWQELHEFINNGFSSFKHMNGAQKFLQIIEKREKNILDLIFQEHPDPFSLNSQKH